MRGASARRRRSLLLQAMPVPGPSDRSGLARPEWVFLLGALLFVLSIALPSCHAVRHRQRLAMARADLRTLMESGLRYYREYGAWPSAHSGEPGDYRYGREVSNAEVLNVLRSQPGPGNEDYRVNTEKMIFLEVEPYRRGWSGLSPDGAFLDPWGMPYEIVFDTDYNNVCEVRDSVYGRLIGEGMVVWSCGPDRQSDTADDLRSWKLP